jgi:hypothetical protein
VRTASSDVVSAAAWMCPRTRLAASIAGCRTRQRPVRNELFGHRPIRCSVSLETICAISPARRSISSGDKSSPLFVILPGPSDGIEMANNVQPPPRGCIFCGGSPRSATHIWPAWLNRLYPTGHRGSMGVEKGNKPGAPEVVSEVTIRQGGLFSQSPYLACIECNTGWMKYFEDEVLKFIIPILNGSAAVKITPFQTQILAGWICLVAILAEYLKRDSVSISQQERLYIKRFKRPPTNNWAIFVASLSGLERYGTYSHHAHTIVANLPIGSHPGHSPRNTQVTSFGVGHLFVHAFSSPHWKIVGDFEIAARARGLTQIWPIPRRILWPLAKRPTKFPLKLSLSEEEADEVADAFSERLRVLTGVGFQVERR